MNPIADIPYQAATPYGRVAKTSGIGPSCPAAARHARDEEGCMSDAMYPSSTREAAQKRRELMPATEEAFQALVLSHRAALRLQYGQG
jgi:hypothetical protein